MAAIVTNTAEILMLQLLLNIVAQDGGTPPTGGNRRLRLFSSNTTPTAATIIGELTETTIAGYSAITLTGTSWSTTTTAGVGLAFYSQQTFTFTTEATLYGYYVTTADVSPQLIWVERFTDGPYELASGGGNVGVTPRIKLNDKNS